MAALKARGPWLLSDLWFARNLSQLGEMLVFTLADLLLVFVVDEDVESVEDQEGQVGVSCWIDQLGGKLIFILAVKLAIQS